MTSSCQGAPEAVAAERQDQWQQEATLVMEGMDWASEDWQLAPPRKEGGFAAGTQLVGKQLAQQEGSFPLAVRLAGGEMAQQEGRFAVAPQLVGKQLADQKPGSFATQPAEVQLGLVVVAGKHAVGLVPPGGLLQKVCCLVPAQATGELQERSAGAVLADCCFPSLHSLLEGLVSGCLMFSAPIPS